MNIQTFREYINTTINESGNAVKDQIGIRPIKQKEVLLTLKNIKKDILTPLGIKDDEYAVLGSIGKKSPEETSGDIDCAIFTNTVCNTLKCDVSDVVDKLTEWLKSKFNYSIRKTPGLGIVTIAYPIEDSKEDFVQLDLMFSESIAWSKFAWHSPDFTKQESKYKGLYRNVLLQSIVTVISFEVLDTLDTGEVKEFQKWTYNRSKGLERAIKSYIGKKGSIIKTPATLERELITNSPREFINLIFGEDFEESDLNSFESLLELIQDPNYEHFDKYEDIIKETIKNLKKDKAPIPNEISYMSESVFGFNTLRGFLFEGDSTSTSGKIPDDIQNAIKAQFKKWKIAPKAKGDTFEEETDWNVTKTNNTLLYWFPKDINWDIELNPEDNIEDFAKIVYDSFAGFKDGQKPHIFFSNKKTKMYYKQTSKKNAESIKEVNLPFSIAAKNVKISGTYDSVFVYYGVNQTGEVATGNTSDKSQNVAPDTEAVFNLTIRKADFLKSADFKECMLGFFIHWYKDVKAAATLSELKTLMKEKNSQWEDSVVSLVKERFTENNQSKLPGENDVINKQFSEVLAKKNNTTIKQIVKQIQFSVSQVELLYRFKNNQSNISDDSLPKLLNTLIDLEKFPNIIQNNLTYILENFEVDRDQMFKKIRSTASKIIGHSFRPDKWNPGDVYMIRKDKYGFINQQLDNIEAAASTNTQLNFNLDKIQAINNLFVNLQTDVEEDENQHILSISLKNDVAQWGRATDLKRISGNILDTLKGGDNKSDNVEPKLQINTKYKWAPEVLKNLREVFTQATFQWNAKNVETDVLSNTDKNLQNTQNKIKAYLFFIELMNNKKDLKELQTEIQKAEKLTATANKLKELDPAKWKELKQKSDDDVNKLKQKESIKNRLHKLQIDSDVIDWNAYVSADDWKTLQHVIIECVNFATCNWSIDSDIKESQMSPTFVRLTAGDGDKISPKIEQFGGTLAFTTDVETQFSIIDTNKNGEVTIIVSDANLNNNKYNIQLQFRTAGGLSINITSKEVKKVK